MILKRVINFLKSKKTSLISVSDYNLPPFQALHKRNDNWELLLKNMKKYNQIFIKIFIVTRACFIGLVFIAYLNTTPFTPKNLEYFIYLNQTCDLNNKNDLLLLNIYTRALDEKNLHIVYQKINYPINF